MFVVRFRVIAKSLIAFIKAQLHDDTHLRLPNPAAPHENPPLATSPQAAQALTHLESVRHNKQYMSLKDDIQVAVEVIKDPAQTCLDAPVFLVRLVSSLFVDKKYLHVLRRKI